jgi:hypothetical protein
MLKKVFTSVKFAPKRQREERRMLSRWSIPINGRNGTMNAPLNIGRGPALQRVMSFPLAVTVGAPAVAQAADPIAIRRVVARSIQSARSGEAIARVAAMAIRTIDVLAMDDGADRSGKGKYRVEARQKPLSKTRHEVPWQGNCIWTRSEGDHIIRVAKTKNAH